MPKPYQIPSGQIPVDTPPKLASSGSQVYVIGRFEVELEFLDNDSYLVRK
jgi:hypothetical protein